jgi:hypothetical protein
MQKYLAAVTLWVRRGCEDAFRKFEAKSLAIAARHGGRVVRAIRLSSEAADEDAPYEFHLLEFPSQGAFAAYRNDSDNRALDSERTSVIAKAELVAGEGTDVPVETRTRLVISRSAKRSDTLS